MANKILIVDDEVNIVRLIEARLKSAGFDTISAYNGLDGLTLAREQLPNLIILDVMMPKMDGFNVCRLLKFDEKYKAIPIILLTAKKQQTDKEVGQEVLADSYLTKPFDGEELLKEVKRLLATPQ